MTAVQASARRAAARAGQQRAAVPLRRRLRWLAALLPAALLLWLWRPAPPPNSTEPIAAFGAAPAARRPIAPLFTPEVQRWASDISRWAAAYQLDPNLLATVMQIESCGDPDIASSAGAQGLFQVMPFHFTLGEVMTDPETNARRGASFLAWCMDYAGRNSFMAMACYNGGPSVVHRDFMSWAAETRRYYVWGGTIYNDARAGLAASDSLNTWLNAGGAGLCAIARQQTL